jgi:proteic killer suppression protein
MKDVSELKAWPLWKVHTLTGSRKGTWSLYVTHNWRLTFRVEANEIFDVNLEGYH